MRRNHRVEAAMARAFKVIAHLIHDMAIPDPHTLIDPLHRKIGIILLDRIFPPQQKAVISLPQNEKQEENDRRSRVDPARIISAVLRKTRANRYRRASALSI